MKPLLSQKLVRLAATLAWLPLAAMHSPLSAADEPHPEPTPLKVYQLEPEWLKATKAQIAAGDSVRAHALNELVRLADQALDGPLYSITNKKQLPPSGDKHDYVSVGPYWWPNPETADGLPWIRRDGEVNRAARNAAPDSHTMSAMSNAVNTLALAYFFTEQEVYAARATELLQVFFLNPATRMNPNLTFGQGIPGRTTGRGIGIIESRKLMAVIDAIGLLEPSASLTADVQRDLQGWFTNFLDWLLTSDNGKKERAEHNNHGTFYDAQVAQFALFTEQAQRVQSALQSSARDRLDTQIGPAGEQPHELARTRPFHYSVFNLQAFFSLAQIGTHLELDLWNYQHADGTGLKHALDYLNHYEQHPVSRDSVLEQHLGWNRLQPLNQLAGLIYGAEYSDASLRVLQSGQGDLQCLLLFPVPGTAQLQPLAETLLQQEASELCIYQ